MRLPISLIGMLLLSIYHSVGLAQTIQGQISDAITAEPIADVVIQNLYTQTIITTADDGKFAIPVTKGQLIEFKKEGYRVIRLRIPQGNLPPYFKVIMDKPLARPQEIAGAPKDWVSDSIRYYQMYKKELEFQKFSTLDAIKHPFSAMSKRNQQIWAFQEEFIWYQKQKYIDYTFNEKIIESVTGLTGDSAQTYMQMFRPTYDQLRNMNEYTYHSYIKRSVAAFRERGIRARMPANRNSR